MLDREAEDEILRLYLDEGLPRRAVAALAFVSEASVSRVVKRRGRFMRPKNAHRISHEDFRKVVAMYEDEGLSVRQIGKRLGRDYRVVHRWLRFAGAKMRPPKGG